MTAASDGPPGERVVVDARGRMCPQPVIDAARVARDRPAETVLEVLATDPAAALDLPAWARMRGHAVLSVDGADGADGADGTVRVVVRLA